MKKSYLIGHTDLDGIARASAILLAVSEFRDAKVFIRFSKVKPSTEPRKLIDFLAEVDPIIPEGSHVLFEDIAINIKDPEGYAKAIKSFAKKRKIVWSDHHETDVGYLNLLKHENIDVFWVTPSPYEYTIKLIKYLGGSIDNRTELLAKLCGVGDRDPTIVQKFESQLVELLTIGNGLDVIIREISKGVHGEYEDLVRKLAFKTKEVIGEAKKRANEIPRVKGEKINNKITIVNQVLPQGWSHKSLEIAALENKTKYAIGIKYSDQEQVYRIKAITLWTELAKGTKPILHIIREELERDNITYYGHDPAPTIGEFKTFKEALEYAKKLAQQI